MSGQPFVFLSGWGIYSLGEDGAKRRCLIHFHPAAATALDLLPQPVQRLARSLDSVLGSGADEGTLQPTARIRTEVSYAWANLAMRPWAVLTAHPHNSRTDVDAELKKYARKGPTFRRRYREIYARYPAAEQALARYYKATFGKDSAAASALAQKGLDVVFRTYFVFPKSGDD